MNSLKTESQKFSETICLGTFFEQRRCLCCKKKRLFLGCFYEFLTELLVCLVLLVRCPFLPPHILLSVRTNDRKPSSLHCLVHSGTAGIEKYHQPVCASYFKLCSILWCLTLFNYVRTYHSTRFYNSQHAEPTTQLIRNTLV